MSGHPEARTPDCFMRIVAQTTLRSLISTVVICILEGIAI